MPAPGRGEVGRNREVPGPTQNSTTRQESIFFRIDRVRLQFDHKLASEGKDPLQAAWRFERREREEEVDEAVAAGKHAVRNQAIEPVSQPLLLTGLEGKVPPYQRSGRQQATEQHVCAEVHVMMAVEAVGVLLVETAVFVELGRYDVLEGPNEPGVKDCSGHGVPQ